MQRTSATPVTTLVWYYPKSGRAEELTRLVTGHWTTLHRLGLATDRPGQVWRAHDKRSGEPFLVELFEWRDTAASEIAHQTPEVMAIWETMGPLLESMKLAQLDAVPIAE
jgi:hypothetical protein